MCIALFVGLSAPDSVGPWARFSIAGVTEAREWGAKAERDAKGEGGASGRTLVTVTDHEPAALHRKRQHGEHAERIHTACTAGLGR